MIVGLAPLLACGACRQNGQAVAARTVGSSAAGPLVALAVDVPAPVVVDGWVPPRAWRPTVRRPLGELDVMVLDPTARILWRGTTSADGEIRTDPDWPRDATLAVRASVPSLAISVVDCPYAHCAPLASTWAHRWPLGDAVDSGQAVIDARSATAGAFAIALTLAAVARQAEAALDRELPPLVARWMQGEGTSCGTTCFIEGGVEVDAIAVLGQDSDSDHFDAGILAHEFGHFVHSALASADDHGGYHDGTPTSPPLAWSEGFATWFAVVATDDRLYLDSHRDGGAWYDYRGTTALAQPHLAASQDLSEDLVVELLLEVAAPDLRVGMSELLHVLGASLCVDAAPGRSVTGLDLIDVLDAWGCAHPERAAAIEQAARSRGLALDSGQRRCCPRDTGSAEPPQPGAGQGDSAQSPITPAWVRIDVETDSTGLVVTVDATARLVAASLEILVHRADGSRARVDEVALGEIPPGSLTRVPLRSPGSDGLVEARLRFALAGGSAAVFSTSAALDGTDAGAWPVGESTILEIGGLGRHRVNGD